MNKKQKIMDKTTQDLVWSILPKEFKEEVKKLYTEFYNEKPHSDCSYGYLGLLIKLFGVHNLTSDAEEPVKDSDGNEWICVPREQVQEQYALNVNALRKENLTDMQTEIATKVKDTLYYLFGSKCLPDNVDSLEPKPAEPKFKPNDKVIFENMVCTIMQVCYADCTYSLMKDKTGAFVAWIEESNLKPYTEPILQPFSQVKETKASVETGNNLFGQQFDGTSIAAHGKTDDHIADTGKMIRLNIAAIVLQGFVSNPDWSNFKGKNNAELRQKMAKGALDFADALIAESEKGCNNE